MAARDLDSQGIGNSGQSKRKKVNADDRRGVASAAGQEASNGLNQVLGMEGHNRRMSRRKNHLQRLEDGKTQ